MSTAQLHPIRAARLKRRLTQQEVADRLGVTKGTVSRWETGTDEPMPRTAIALIRVLPGLTFQQIYREAA
ncbi:helix-turn-helix transcriptional regulator [Dyella amyloliquefaciens]|uniref:helix-turn-helix transcriptional regulator n=1 Tax=Dyella amyloliquefaciens TaxID=1770545 RepID=UPI00102ED0C8|nr:helix-turn-helix transcriptional regulator [Dyella amyloliquefaciens]